MHATATLQQERAEMRKLPIIAEAVEEEEVVPQASVVESIEENQVSKDGTTPDEAVNLSPTLDKQVSQHAPSKMASTISVKQQREPTIIDNRGERDEALLATNQAEELLLSDEQQHEAQ